jgi:hypothetical protein
MILAGTGHRPNKLRIGALDGYQPRVQTRLMDLARAALRRRRPDLVISGMAIGWDTALAIAAVDVGIPFDAYVPFEGQESRWPPAARGVYRDLLRLARRTIIVSEAGYSPEAMQFRNERMVDDCDSLLALWNGTPGGTANCLRYADAVGRPYENLWRQWVRHADPTRRPPEPLSDPVMAGLLAAAGA